MAPWKSLLSVLSLASAASGLSVSNVCTQQPYEQFLPLSKYSPAQSFCSEIYPLEPSTASVTKTVTATHAPITVRSTASTVTVTVTTATTSINNVVGRQTSTTYTATVRETDYTTTSIATVTTATATHTVYTSTSTHTVTTQMATGAPKAKRVDAGVEMVHGVYFRPTSDQLTHPAARDVDDAFAADLIKRSADSTDGKKCSSGKMHLWRLLWKLDNEDEDIIETACSCIETAPAAKTVTVSTATATAMGRTVTSLVTSTQTTSVRATSMVGVTSTVVVSAATTTTVRTNSVSTTRVGATTTVSTYATTTTFVAPPAPSCTSGDTYADGGYECQFDITCGAVVTSAQPGSPTVHQGVLTVTACNDLCDNDSNCNIWSWDGSAHTCSVYDNSYNHQTTNNVNGAWGLFTGHCNNQ